MPEENSPIRANYPANSHKAKVEKAAPTEKKVESVVTGKVVQRKKPLGAKIAETFAGEDAKSVGDHILFDVLIPAAKAAISDAASQGVERLLFGEVRSRRATSSVTSRTNYTSYNRPVSSPGRAFEPDGARSMSRRARATHDFNEIVLEDRGQAEGVLDGMGALIDKYDICTVSDLYDLVGITGNYTDDKWGWTDLRGAEVRRIREGYLLNLPRPVAID